jgi:AcrR family transcriptional regulator
MKKIKADKKPAAKAKKTLLRRMSKNPEKAEKLREKVYEAVARVLMKHRSGTFTLDEVAAEIGVTKGVIYYYFHSRGEMLYQLNKYIFKMMHEDSDPIWGDNNLKPRQKLEAVVRSYMHVNVKHWQVARVLWSDMGLREGSQHQAGVINRERREFRRRIAGVVKDIVTAERCDPVDEHIAAWFIYGILVFSSVWFRTGGEMTEEQVCDFVTKLIFEGLFIKKSP